MNVFTGLKRCSAIIALAVLTFGTGAQSTRAADLPTPDTTPTDSDLSNIDCAISEEKFLPGDYYYCLATQSYGYHRYAQAQRFFLTAASWASKPAQYVLGVMALNGDQQPIDRPRALAWYTLAAERHRQDFDAAFRQLETSATPNERSAADALLETLRLTYADAVAAPRAERRYREGMNELTRGSIFGVHCLSGVRLNGSSNSSIACAQIPALVQTIDQAADKVFDGWSGHVTVGTLQPVPATTK